MFEGRPVADGEVVVVAETVVGDESVVGLASMVVTIAVAGVGIVSVVVEAGCITF